MGDSEAQRLARAALAAAVTAGVVIAAMLWAGQASARQVHASLGTFGPAGQPSLVEPKALAVDQASEDVYAVEGRNEVERITVSATAGKFVLKHGALERELAFNASAIQTLIALGELYCGGLCAFVSGGPGDAGGSHPYTVTFKGVLATTNVEQVVCESSVAEPLSGGVPGSGCAVETTVEGVNGAIRRFDKEGDPVSFSALGGSNAIDGRGGEDLTPQGGLAFEGSPGLTQVAIAPAGSPAGTAGDIYVTQSSRHLADVFAPTGKYLGQLSEYEETPGNEATLKPLNEVCGAATDAAGNLYLGDFSSKDLVHKYTPSANPVANKDNTKNYAALAGPSSPCTLAAGAESTAGFLFVNRLSGELFKLDAASDTLEYGGAPFATGNTTVAVDPATGRVFAAKGKEVLEYDASGPIAPSGPVSSLEVPTEVTGIAVNGTSGEIYVAREGSEKLTVFGPFAVLPDVETGGASGIAPEEATLHGQIGAAGEAGATCRFEYLTKATYEAQKAAAEAGGEKNAEEIENAAFAGAASAGCEPPGPFAGSESRQVSGEATGLAAETGYAYRLVGENANPGLSGGGARFFESGGSPTLAGEQADQVTASAARLSAEVDPHGLATSVVAQYVTEAQFTASGFAEATQTPPLAVPAQSTGTGTLSAASGIGATAAGFAQISGLTTTAGTFKVGQTIAGTGIQPNTTITAVDVVAGSIGLSQAATQTTALAAGKGDLVEGSQTIEEAEATAGAFAAGQGIAGAGIPANTTIAAVEETAPGVFALTISKAVEAGGSGTEVALKAGLALAAGSKEVTDLATTAGTFTAGQSLEGAGIAEGTTIAAVNGNTLTLSLPAVATGKGVALTASGPQRAVRQLAGLAPGTPYRFRFLATNSHGEAQGEAKPFATLTEAVALPDGRAYEMVSPPVKGGEPFSAETRSTLGGNCPEGVVECLPGGDVTKMPMQPSPDGNSMAYEGEPFSGGLSPSQVEYLGTRGQSGWATQGLSGPNYSSVTVNGLLTQGFQAFTAGLGRAVVAQVEPPLAAATPRREGKGFADLYRWEAGTPTPLITGEPPSREPGERDPDKFLAIYAGADSSFDRIVFAANDALATAAGPAAPAVGPEEFDLYQWEGGALRLVNVLPDGTPAPDAAIGSGRLLDPGFGAGGPVVDHAVSADGRRVYWTDLATEALYLRIDGTETRKVEDPGGGHFLTASEDGSKVLLSDGCLYSTATESCTDLSEGEGGFQGILGASGDLASVYFLDTAVLPAAAGEQSENGEEAEAGKENLYLRRGGQASFVAQLLPADNEIAGSPKRMGDWRPSPTYRTAQVSADGRYVAFMSAGEPTGYDNELRGGGECAGAVSGGAHCQEVYEYDAATNRLRCVSCNPTGLRPLGYSNLTLIDNANEASIFPQPHNLAADGRVFFESQDVLSPADVNGAVQDVYEWTPEGSRGCLRAGGCTGLISSGSSPLQSLFVNATPDGSNAFFVTRQRLLPQDEDDLMDLYDAREGGGFTPQGTAPCAGEACRGPLASAPAQAAPASSSFTGPGNEKPAKHKKKKHHKKKHHKKRHHKHKHKGRHHKRAHKQGGRGR